MAKNTKMAGIVCFAAIALTSCGAQANVVSQDGPIENPAIEAGMTQSQGAPGPDGVTFDTENLEIELDGETVEINDVEDLGQLENFTLEDAQALANCEALLSVAPSLAVERCSYAPNAAEVIVDRLAGAECENGNTYVTLNRIDGSGAYVGVVGETWVELSQQDLNLQTVELICQGATS